MANFIGRALVVLMGYLFVPIYLKYLGAEWYGLVGFWATLAGVFAVLDRGLNATLKRDNRLGFRPHCFYLLFCTALEWITANLVPVRIFISKTSQDGLCRT